MNPHHLEVEELDYELSIRKITSITGVDNKKRALRRRFKDEADHPSEGPQVAHSEEVLSDFGPLIESLQHELAIAFKNNDSYKLNILKSRLYHWLSRLGRVNIVNSSYMEIYRAYQTSVNDYIAKINDLVVKPKHKKKTVDGKALLPLPSDNESVHDNILSSSRNDKGTEVGGAESLERQGFPTLSEEDKLALDKAHKLIFDLTGKSPDLMMSNSSFNLENLSIAVGGNQRRNSTPQVNALNTANNVQEPEEVTSSESEEEEVVYDFQIPGRNQNGRNARIQIPVPYLRKGLPVSRWSVKFSGDASGLKLPEFLNQVDMIAVAERATDEDLHRSALYLFEGFAKTWYMAFRRNYSTWAELVSGLKTQFLPFDYEYWQMKDIENRFQKSDESFGVFLAAMELMFNELPYRTAERQKVQIIRRNLLPAYQDRLALVDTNTIAQLTFACDRIEHSQYSAMRRTQQQPSFSQTRPEASSPRVSVPVDLSTYRCFNCKNLGHHFNDCLMERRLFCFRCGKSNFSTLNCPNCKSKNMERGPC